MILELLSKTALFIIKNVQLSLIESCNSRMMSRIEIQKFLTTTVSDLSLYLKDFFKSCRSESILTDNFSPEVISSVQINGLESFSTEDKSSIIKKMANLMKERVVAEHGGLDKAREHSDLFHNVSDEEHEKFLTNYMLATQMYNIKEGVKQLSGTHVFFRHIWECIKRDDWEKYSIYFNEKVQLAFRSQNTVKFNTSYEENQNLIHTKWCAHLSFTPFGMKKVLEQSEDLQEYHIKKGFSGEDRSSQIET